MAKFRDNKDREWLVEINIGTIKRVRKLIDVDILDCVKEKDSLIDRMALDPVLLVDILYGVCEPQATEAKVSDEQFGEAMAGDVIGYATSAFLEALVDFFHGARKNYIKRAIEIRTHIEQAAEKRAGKALELLDQNMIEKAVGILFERHGELLANSQESLA